jgi:hypothetical protein
MQHLFGAMKSTIRRNWRGGGQSKFFEGRCYSCDRPPVQLVIALVVTPELDELYTTYSFLGSRRMTGVLRAEGLRINRKCVQRLMRSTALGPKAAHHQAHTRP